MGTLALRLLIAHVLADYVLQPLHMIEFKRPSHYDQHGPWWWWMTAHAVVNGAAVWWATGWINAFWFEFVSHWWLDYLKCRGRITANEDQLGHLYTKGVIWAAVMWP